MNARRLFSFFTAVLLMVVVAGCGNSKSSSSATTTSTAASMNMSGTTATTATATGTGTGTSTDASVVEVSIQNFAFNPSTITVKAGTTVKWTNLDSATHTVTSGANRTADKKFDQSMPQGQTFSYTFTTPGEYDYFCRPHASMNAKVIVQ